MSSNEKSTEVAHPREDAVSQQKVSSDKSTVNRRAPKNWDKIVRDFEEEEKEAAKGGDGSVDTLFQEIYEKGGEDVRRAMNKSFTESGGTVLSTNWSEVGKDKVQVKPPDGCEFKKY